MLRGEALLPEDENPQPAMAIFEPSVAREIYLKLDAINLDDDEAILGFVNAFGVLGVRFEGYSVFRGLSVGRRLERRLNRAVASARSASEPESRWDDAAPIVAETLTEFRTGALLLRDLVQARRVCNGELAVTDTTWHLAAIEGPSKALIAQFLSAGLTAALRPFAPRLSFRSTAGPPDPRVAWAVEAPLYSQCALELYNHIVEDARYRRCGCCQRLFVRKEGGARHAQHRTTGVKYCSARCQQIMSQRRYRGKFRGPVP